VASKEGKSIAAVVAYCGVCGHYVIAKDYKASTEHRMLIGDHIKAKHKDAKLNLWRGPFNARDPMSEVYTEDFATEAVAKSWQAGAKKMGWKGTSEI
jgi:hypothetical protein